MIRRAINDVTCIISQNNRDGNFIRRRNRPRSFEICHLAREIKPTETVRHRRHIAHFEHRRLLDVVAGLDAAKLDAIVPGKDYPVAVMLHGTAQHYGYHAGQIALLKKLMG